MYRAEVIDKISNGQGYWESYKMGVFEGDKLIGSYVRNYSPLNTFCPFQKDGKWYALYSKNYTCTRVMSLPDCIDLGGEEPTAHGFCPVEYYVPDGEEDSIENPGHWGFVAGCVWGDDTSWKIEYLDLSRVEEGIVKREARFGYLEMADGLSLKEAIKIDDYRPLKNDPEFADSKTPWYVHFSFATKSDFNMHEDGRVEHYHHSMGMKDGWNTVWPEDSKK